MPAMPEMAASGIASGAPGDFHDAAHQHHAHGDDQANVVHDVERLEQLVAGEVVLQSEQRGDQEYREPEHQQVRVHKSQRGLPGELARSS